MKRNLHILAAVAFTAPLCFGLGRATAEAPGAIQMVFAAPDTMESTVWPECPIPDICPAPDAHCPNLHERATKAIGETLLADAYVRGTEDKQKMCARFDALYEKPPKPGSDECCESCALWDGTFDLMHVGLQTMLMDTESSNWYRACTDLYDHWPTPSTVEGDYPDDFPRYCR